MTVKAHMCSVVMGSEDAGPQVERCAVFLCRWLISERGSTMMLRRLFTFTVALLMIASLVPSMGVSATQVKTTWTPCVKATDEPPFVHVMECASGMELTAEQSGLDIELSWIVEEELGSPSSVQIYRGATPATLTLIDVVDGNERGYLDQGAVSEGGIIYQVVAVDESGDVMGESPYVVVDPT